MAIRENDLIYLPFRNMLRDRGWHVVKTHGNEFQRGLPDTRIMHHAYGGRWVEFKVIDRTPKGTPQIHLTTSQKKLWPIWVAHGEKIWVVCGETFKGASAKPLMEKWYNRILYGEPNVHFLLHPSTVQFGIYP